MFLFNKPTDLPAPAEALPGRVEPILRPNPHHVNGRPIIEPYPDGLQVAEFAMGCFWGAEKGFWQLPGVWATAVGYQGGFTPNATYRETCTGKTGHAEAVRVVFDPAKVRYEQLLAHFWESHDPTQGMRQGNDVGTQYRSAIFPADAGQRAAAIASRDAYQERLLPGAFRTTTCASSTAPPAAIASRDAYQERLTAAGFGRITTEISGPPAPAFYFAEDEHQQYLSKNPFGYCPDHGTGVSCPVGVGVATGMGTEA